MEDATVPVPRVRTANGYWNRKLTMEDIRRVPKPVYGPKLGEDLVFVNGKPVGKYAGQAPGGIDPRNTDPKDRRTMIAVRDEFGHIHDLPLGTPETNAEIKRIHQVLQVQSGKLTAQDRRLFERIKQLEKEETQ